MSQTTTLVIADNTGNSAPALLDENALPFSVDYLTNPAIASNVQVSNTSAYDPQGYVWFPVNTEPPNGLYHLSTPYAAIRLSGVNEGDSMTVIQYNTTLNLSNP